MTSLLRKVTPLTYSNQIVNHNYVADVIKTFYKNGKLLDKAMKEGPYVTKFDGSEIDAMYALDYYFRNNLLDQPGYLDINYYTSTGSFNGSDCKLFLKIWADKKEGTSPYVKVIMERLPSNSECNK